MTSRRFSHSLKRFGALLCLFSLFAQVALPVAHEWQTAVAEAAYHHDGSSASDAAIEADAGDSGSRHHHHDPASCRICPELSSFRHAVPLQSYSFHPPTPKLTAVSDVSSPRISFTDRGGASPRSPPPA